MTIASPIADKDSPLAESLDITAERILQFKTLFPEVFSDGKIDFDRLRTVLGDHTVETQQKWYELSWVGKEDARREIQKRTKATLRQDVPNSVNWDATQNLYIEGENLEVLRVLQKAYYGMVKMIYIDPPYNTGNDNFVYPDNYSETLGEYRARSGQTNDEGFLNKQDMWKKNTKEHGQFHSVWLSMMYPRLFFARNLLREDGVIFVSIDDNEAANLKLLMDEVFGEDNFVADFIWQHRKSSQNDIDVSLSHNHTFCYAKMRDIFKLNPLKINSEKFSNPDGDPRGDWVADPLDAPNIRPNLTYPIVNPNTGEQYLPPNGRHWRFSREKFANALSENRIVFGKTGKSRPQYKRFKSEAEEKGTNPFTIWTEMGTSTEGTKELMSLFGGVKIFDTPKPVRLITEILLLASSARGECIILDFFSGSATTAQAVLELNEEDGGNRQFICVQLPEKLEENTEAFRAGYRTIADVGRARIQKVIERIEAQRTEIAKQGKLGVDTDGDNTPKQALGFNAFRLASSNFKAWQREVKGQDNLFTQMGYQSDNAEPDSLLRSMLYELLLKISFPTTTPIKTHNIAGGQVYTLDLGESRPIVIFFDMLSPEITKFIVQFRPKPIKVLCPNKSLTDNHAFLSFDFQLKKADITLEVF